MSNKVKKKKKKIKADVTSSNILSSKNEKRKRKYVDYSEYEPETKRRKIDEKYSYVDLKWCQNKKKGILEKININKRFNISNIDKITEDIFLGSCGFDFEDLEKMKIKTIINCCIEEDDSKFEFYDVETEDILSHFDFVFNLIENSKKPILVHCQLGISRSASFVIAYLMKKRNLSFEESFEFVLRKRRIISPNAGFVRQLLYYQSTFDRVNKEK